MYKRQPITRFTHAVNALEPAGDTAGTMAEQGPEEVRRAARAFNAMQTRIHDHLQERARILAAISHDLQTPITRMKLRVEMADQPELRDKLLQDLDNMTRLVREGIAFARTSQPLAEARQRLNLDVFLDSIACDYADVGRPVRFCPCLLYTSHPFAPGLRVRAVGHDRRVFQRNGGLVVKPVRHPALNLLAGRVAVMHGNVVRVVNMVEGAFGPQGLFKGLRRQRVGDQHAVS